MIAPHGGATQREKSSDGWREMLCGIPLLPPLGA